MNVNRFPLSLELETNTRATLVAELCTASILARNSVTLVIKMYVEQQTAKRLAVKAVVITFVPLVARRHVLLASCRAPGSVNITSVLFLAAL